MKKILNFTFLCGRCKNPNPKEYEALKAAIPKDQHKTTLDILLIIGMAIRGSFEAL